ncbi:radical SAM protein [Jiella marina]|uniref:radical SAM protein n=1 Tax=Jiella sp. LLJ827 TaxID=2917712 RepID=UPI0021014D5C|nr:radical SAM protein [Jiella sp. LLJ827]MCQ0989414.1 radical SAM protein [Jiella sp. LLJ827]
MAFAGELICDPALTVPELVSIELTNRCNKGCPFCYNHSTRHGEVSWTVEELTAFIADCAAHGTRAVSFGGGEPLQFEGLLAVLDATRHMLFRSLTTNGLLLDAAWIRTLAKAGIEKIHVSIHFPHVRREVSRVIRQVKALEEAGIASGINLLVPHAHVDAARSAAALVEDAGIGRDRIVLLPERGEAFMALETIAEIAKDRPFQSMSCLKCCQMDPRFASVGWDKRVGWCSYTPSRRKLETLDAHGLSEALRPLDLAYCGPATLDAPTARDITLHPHDDAAASRTESRGRVAQPVGAALPETHCRTRERVSRADYPAAHSQMTYWFGADADGQIALFDPYDQAPVPGGAAQFTDIPRFFDGLTADASGCRPLHLDASPALDFFRGKRLEIPRTDTDPSAGWEFYENVLMWVDDMAAFTAALRNPPVEPLPFLPAPPREVDAAAPPHDQPIANTAYPIRFSGQPSLLHFAELSLRDLWHLRDQGVIDSFFFDGDSARRDPSWRPFFGLERFHVPTMECAPYVRSDRRPVETLTLEVLGQDGFAPSGLVHFPEIRFAEAQEFQPAVLVPCSSWGNGTVRLIDGTRDRLDRVVLPQSAPRRAATALKTRPAP